MNTLLFKLLLALPALIVGNILVGMGKGSYENEFDMALVKKGLLKGVLIYAAIAILAGVGYYLNDFQVNINGANVTILGALEILMYGTVGWYIVEILGKLSEILPSKVKAVIEESNISQADLEEENAHLTGEDYDQE